MTRFRRNGAKLVTLVAALLLGVLVALPLGYNHLAAAIDCTVDLCGFSAGQAQGLRDTYVDEYNDETVAGDKTFSGVLDAGGGLEVGGTVVSSTAAELDEYAVYTCIVDISTAQSDWIVAPHAGAITDIWTVIDGAIGTADADITLELAGTLVTGSTVTVATASSAAGDVDTATATAANTVAAGDAIEVITDGASTNTVEVCVTIIIER